MRVAAVLPNCDAQYYLTDQVDSVKVVTDSDGLIVTSFEYLPFGEDWITEGDTKNAPKYNSQELDKESGYYFYNARHYDPEIGRFVTADNVVPDQFSTQSWNRFSYCRNNPIIYKDPTGHWDIEIPGKSEAGHEVLTKMALKEVGMKSNIEYFISGSRENDIDDTKASVGLALIPTPLMTLGAAMLGKMYYDKHKADDAQADHFMRTKNQSPQDAFEINMNRIQDYTNKAMEARENKNYKMENYYLGRAMHTIQDSFAEEHAKRNGNKITDIRPYDKSHTKDSIWGKSSNGQRELKSEAKAAVNASVDFLNGYYKNIANGDRRYNINNNQKLMKNFEFNNKSK